MKKSIAIILMLVVALLATSMISVAANYTAGTYSATVGAFNGPLKVEVTFSDSAITEVKIVEHAETLYIAAPAIERIPVAIVNGQTLKVDVVSGATYTSEAIVEAVAACVIAAGGNLEVLN